MSVEDIEEITLISDYTPINSFTSKSYGILEKYSLSKNNTLQYEFNSLDQLEDL